MPPPEKKKIRTEATSALPAFPFPPASQRYAPVQEELEP